MGEYRRDAGLDISNVGFEISNLNFGDRSFKSVSRETDLRQIGTDKHVSRETRLADRSDDPQNKLTFYLTHDDTGRTLLATAHWSSK